MLNKQRLCIVQLIQRDVDLEILLRQRHVLIHLCHFYVSYILGRQSSRCITSSVS